MTTATSTTATSQGASDLALVKAKQQATWAAGDYAVIGFTGTRDGEPFPGGTAERMPIVIGEDRLIPGFEEHLVGLRVGETAEFDITFPEDYVEASLAGQVAHFSATLKELREKVRPPADDEFAKSLGLLVPAHGLVQPIVGGGSRSRTVPPQHGSCPSLADDAGVIGAIVLALQFREQLPGILHARSCRFTELIGPSEEKQHQCPLVAGITFQDVQADTLRLQRLVEQAVVVRALDGVGNRVRM